MNHETAVKGRAAERYVLAEMNPQERDAFEEHFFSCGPCAEEIRLLSVFVENAKAVLREPGEPWPLQRSAPPARPPQRWFGGLFPSFAMGGLATFFAVMLAVQVGTNHQLLEARLAPAIVLHGQSRGAIPPIAAGQPLNLLIALEEPVQGPQIAAEIRDEAGAVVKRIAASLSTASAESGLSLYMPDPKLKPGRYAVVIGTTQYPFEVR